MSIRAHPSMSEATRRANSEHSPQAPGQRNRKAQDVGLWLFLQLVVFIGNLYLLMYDIIRQKFYNSLRDHTIPQHTMSHDTIPHNTTQLLFHTYHTTPQHITLYRKYYTILYHATPHPAISHHPMPHNTISYHISLHAIPGPTTPYHNSPHHTTAHHSIASMPYHSTAQRTTPRPAIPHTIFQHTTPHHTTEEPAWLYFGGRSQYAVWLNVSFYYCKSWVAFCSLEPSLP